MAEMVEVVVLGEPTRGYVSGFPDDEVDRPIAEFSTATFEVDADALFIDVLREGGRRAGVPIDYENEFHTHLPSYFSFVDPSGEWIIPWSMSVPVLDQHGQAVWGNTLGNLRYGDVMQAAEASLFLADPRRPVLVLYTDFGDGPGLSWPEVLEGLEVAVKWLVIAATADGVINMGSRARRLIRRAAARIKEAPCDDQRDGQDVVPAWCVAHGRRPTSRPSVDSLKPRQRARLQ